MNFSPAHILCTSLVLLLSACASNAPISPDYSTADLPTNRQFHEVNYGNSNKGVQWVSNKIEPHYYHSLIVSRVELTPDTHYDAQIPLSVLNDLAINVTSKLGDYISPSIDVVDKAGEHVAVLSIRVSRATVVNADLKLRQLMPVGAALTLLKGVTGNESKTAKIIIEAKIKDSVSKELLAERISIIEATGAIKGDYAELNYNQIQYNVARLEGEIRTFIQSAAYEARQAPAH
ncbi:DUF3313 family protein [Shewanella sp. GutDb-MelDb]|uniref:DUF3313 family protein n=1 Tax=Shewanella sp. GutDb-MelDb TaxID=2058316 RepID=UPI000C7D4846|nr:DUF3313 family protein [Shewanella sp. GutDb-MelDb]PKG58567.1 hypothetical protein CXF82_04020 [Shewanella sp. GutDb-MelDb]